MVVLSVSAITTEQLKLACGVNKSPTKVLREIQTFDSSTRPAKVDTDAGEGFIKGIGNPAGDTALISELVAAELGTWFGLSIPDFSIMQHCQIEIPMSRHQGVIEPPMFFSSSVEGTPRDGGDTFLKRLHRPNDVAKLVIFDTWIRNLDRFSDQSFNSDNLLYSPYLRGRKYSLIPIDHSHCFVEVDFATDLPSDDVICDPEVYGFFPEFEAFLTEYAVKEGLEKLNSIEEEFVEEVVNSVPAQWGLVYDSRKNLAEFICKRADFVVNTITKKIIDAPKFDGF